MSELKFEWKNLIKSKLLILGMIIALLFAGINYIYNVLNQHVTYYRLLEEYGNYNNSLNEEVQAVTVILTEKGMSREEIDEYLMMNKKLHETVNQVVLTLETGTREELAQNMSAFYDTYEEYSSRGRPALLLNTLEDKQNAKWINKISDLNLPYEDNDFSLNGAKFTEIVSRRLNGVPLVFITILLGAFIIGDSGTSSEHLRNTLPVKRWKRNLSKVIVSTIYIIFIYLMVLLISFILATIISKSTGSFNYPEIDSIFDFNSSPELSTTGVHLFRQIILAIPLIALLNSFVLLGIMFFKDSTVLSVFLLPFFILVNGISQSFFQKQTITGNIQKWINSINPFVYSNIFNMAKEYRTPIILMVIIGLVYAAVVMLLANVLSQSSAVQRLSIRSPRTDIYKKLEKKKKYNPILTNFLFELLKLFKKRTVIIACLLSILIVVVSSVYSSFEYKKIKESNLETLDLDLKIEEMLVEGNQGPSKSVHQANYKAIREIIDRLDNGDDTALVDFYRYELKNATGGSNFAYEGFGYTPQSATIKTKLLDEIEKRGKTPALSIHPEAMFTPFDKSRTFTELIMAQKWEKPYHNSVNFIINRGFKDIIPIAIMLLLFVLSTGVSEEYSKTKSIDLMNIQPVSSLKIYTSKMMAKIVMVVITFMLALSISAVSLDVLGNTVEADYPVVQYHNVDEKEKDAEMEGIPSVYLSANQGKRVDENLRKQVGFSFRNILNENFEMILMIIAGSLLILTVSGIVSFTKLGKWLISTISILVFAIGFIVSELVIKVSIASIPFMWMNPKHAASGEASMVYNQILFKPIGIILVLGIASFISLTLGVYIYKYVYRRK